MVRALRLFYLSLATSIWLMSVAVAGDEHVVTIYAAASTQGVLESISNVLEKNENIELSLVFAASSTLARQIEHGAPADIYLSANPQWSEYLDGRGLLDSQHHQIVASNTLVVISGPEPFPAPRMVFGPGYPLDSILHGHHIAMADPAHVPAGMYAQQALIQMQLWDDIKDRMAPTRDVTGALLLVAQGQARLGIVYGSDVKRTDKVHIFAPIPERTHEPILYPASIIRGKARPNVLKVLAFLKSPQGQKAFIEAGFKEAP